MAEVYATPPEGLGRANSLDVSERPPALCVKQLEKVFGTRESITHALTGLSFSVEAGEFIGIMGPSGSGKTTLLNCISTLDAPTSGRILVNGVDICSMRRGQLAKFRRENLGFIFQDSNLLETLTGFENIALALSVKHENPVRIRGMVNKVADQLGITDVLNKYPHQMSGGQRQRVAAARAIIGKPTLILADEPTGALDSRNAAIMLETLEMMNRSMGATILMVTHDAFAASFASRILFVKDGALFTELRRGDLPREEFFKRIMEVVAFLGGDASHAS